MYSSVEDESVHRQFDWSETNPSHAVILGVAALEGVKATNLHEKLGTTLSDHIDPDALNTLVSGGTDTAVSFIFGEYSIQFEKNTLLVSN